MRVDAEVARLHGARDLQRPGEIVCPYRAGQPVVGVVGQRDRIRLVLERQDCDDRAEDLLGDDAIGALGNKHRRREPPAASGRRRPAERHRGVLGDVGRDRITVGG